MKQERRFGGHVSSGLNLNDDECQDLRARVDRRVESQGMQRMRPVVLAGVLLIPGLGYGAGYMTFRCLELVGIGRSLSLTITGVGLPLALIAGWFIVFHRMSGRSTREALRAEGCPVCERCGYVMEGIEGAAKCPECGRRQSIALGESGA